MNDDERGAAETDPLVRALRLGGSVFAEEEATLLRAGADDPEQLAAWCARRVAGEPLEHILGWVGFAGLRLAVGPGVFVPRQRSVLVADAAVAHILASGANPTLLEAFCGVAPIATVVHHRVPGASIHLTDADPVALRYARRNVGDDAGVYVGPGFSGVPAHLRGYIDVVAAVPPYVPERDFEQLPHEAREYEPRAALIAGSDGLDHVRELIDDAAEWLSPHGVLVVEMNHAQFDATAEHARARGLRAEVIVGDDGQTVVARLRR